MHFLTPLVLLAALAAPGPKHQTPFPWTHTRPLSDQARKLVSAAAGDSTTVTQLLDTLETTDVVAYVEIRPDSFNAKPIASLTFVGASAEQRFVLIRVDRWVAVTGERAPAVAHELQHALEVARDPTVRNADAMQLLYVRIGYQVGPHEYETTAAQDAERRARHDTPPPSTAAGALK